MIKLFFVKISAQIIGFKVLKNAPSSSKKIFSKKKLLPACLCRYDLQNAVRKFSFFYKTIVYKNIQAQIGQKINNFLKISSVSVLAIVFCMLFSFSKILLIDRTLLI